MFCFFKKRSDSLLWKRFSKILSKFDKSDIGLQLKKSSSDSFLCAGITFSVLRFVGKTPTVTGKLKIFCFQQLQKFQGNTERTSCFAWVQRRYYIANLFLSCWINKKGSKFFVFKKLENCFFESFIFDLVFAVMVLKKLLKIVAIFIGSVIDSSF